MSDADQRPSEEEMQAWVDGRLTPERASVMRAWLDAHPQEAERLQRDRYLRDALRAWLQPRYDEPVPTRLSGAALRSGRRRSLFRRLIQVAAAVLLLLTGGIGGWLAHDTNIVALSGGVGASPLTREAAVAHQLFAVEVRHPVEVTVDQEAHLVQWLSNRLGRPLRVPTLAAEGFQLVGGRLLPSDSAPAAQFMYEDRQGRRLTLYMRADPEDRQSEFQIVERRGLFAFSWVDQGFGYVVVSEISREALLQVAREVYRQVSVPSGGGVF